MKKILPLIMLCYATNIWSQNKDYPITMVPFTQVKLTDDFWMPRIKTNATVTIPASFERCEATGRVKNFEMAAAKKGKFCTIYPFDDTDIYKTIEGASYSLSLFPDAALEKYIDSLITIVGKAQEPDGYLYTARTIDPINVGPWLGKERWEKERELSHELYNAGHLYESAAAHFLATGKRNLLDIAIKNANLVCSVFGPAFNQRKVAPGHEVVEMGLVKLYRITGNALYLSTAKFFIEQRGQYQGYDASSKDQWKNGKYWQDDKPVWEQEEAEGHAVRAGYLYAAMADIAALTGDTKFLQAVDKIWENEVTKKIYLQGGVGAVGDGERFGENYELPNNTAYNETCAAISNIFFNQRMFQLHGDAKYVDILEKTLYNGFISGVGMDGKSFFYTNAMQIKNSFSHADMEAGRSGWFPCSCCPTNVVRLMPSIPGYVYAQKDKSVYINLFISGHTKMTIDNKPVEMVQQNNYPWDGALSFTVIPAAAQEFTILMRIPGWAKNEAMPSNLYTFANNTDKKATITINGEPIDYTLQNGYAVLNRKWKKGDKILVTLPMDVREVMANENVKEDIGKLALQRGPLIYCAEWPDNHGKTSNIILPANSAFTTTFKPELLNGITVLNTNVPVVNVDANGISVNTKNKELTAIPYYAWAHRGKGEMMIWFPSKVKAIDLFAAEESK
ncbi:glycoside hydrolase family 127 protein [Limnovirga soli]|uniref:Glycoside hydrolase family 127 protein n=1 Tax=Limnovirga soli TaxID=2656915 RepID=A0A8J8FB69_9BACT|nr:glycoside hydrolase family 127 protein [Limnovirga soli]NNV54776.1 glycoside hydrolase family 127 protein [Limnovirga soli]